MHVTASKTSLARILVVIFALQGCFSASGSRLFAQDSSSVAVSVPVDTVSEVHPVRWWVVGGGTAGVLAIAHFQNANSWWKGELVPFHLGEDGTKYLHQDKLGHMLFSNAGADLMGRSYIWAGTKPSEAYLYGGISVLVFQTYVEIEDGFHGDLGFSLGDETANIVGAAIPLLRSSVPSLHKYLVKWSANTSERYKQGHYKTLVDDYESQYTWVSANIRELFQTDTPWIPGFLNIAVGMGVTNLDLKGGGDHEIYLALDIDTERLPGDGAFLHSIKHLMNFVHFPAPMIRLTPDVIAYGLRF